MSKDIKPGDFFFAPYAGTEAELLVEALEFLPRIGHWSVRHFASGKQHKSYMLLDGCRPCGKTKAKKIIAAVAEAARGTSPLRLVQERVSRDLHYPWRVMASCALLNRTQGAQVRPVLVALFRDVWPSPEAVFRVGARDVLEPLGLYNRREALLRRLTWDYLAGAQPEACFGVGGYGRDALGLFVHGRRLRAAAVSDRWLGQYAEWRAKGGRALEWDRAGHADWRAAEGFAPLRKPPL